MTDTVRKSRQALPSLSGTKRVSMEDEEESLGDGNCAFNSLVLAICQKPMIDQINPPASFWERAGKALGLNASERKNKETVKARMIATRDAYRAGAPMDNPPLAALMRVIAIEEARKDRDNPDRTMEPLFAAFHGYVMKNKILGASLRGPREDIFTDHTFIVDKFHELSRSITSEEDILEKQQELHDWWITTGYEKFLKGMGQNSKYAGDLELKQVARYFDVNLNIVRAGARIPPVHNAHGFIPIDKIEINGRAMNDTEIAELREALVIRQLIDKPAAGAQLWQLRPLSRDGFLRGLSSVPEVETVLAFIQANKAYFAAESRPSDHRLEVPAAWSKPLIDALKDRDIIGTYEGKLTFNPGLKMEVRLSRITDHPQKDQIMKLWDKFHLNRPDITLRHTGGAHWNNMSPPAPEQPAVKRQATMMRQEK